MKKTETNCSNNCLTETLADSQGQATLAKGITQPLFDKKVVLINMTRRGLVDLS